MVLEEGVQLRAPTMAVTDAWPDKLFQVYSSSSPQSSRQVDDEDEERQVMRSADRRGDDDFETHKAS